MHYVHWLTLLPDLQIVIHKLAPFCLFLRLSQGDSFSFNHSFFILETLIAPVIHK